MFYFTCNESKIYKSFTFWNKLQEKMNFFTIFNFFFRCTCMLPWTTTPSFFFVHPQSPDFKLGWLYLGQILSYANKPYINIKLMYMYKSKF